MRLRKAVTEAGPSKDTLSRREVSIAVSSSAHQSRSVCAAGSGWEAYPTLQGLHALRPNAGIVTQADPRIAYHLESTLPLAHILDPRMDLAVPSPSSDFDSTSTQARPPNSPLTMNLRMAISVIWAAFQRLFDNRDETDGEADEGIKDVAFLGTMVGSAVVSPVLVDAPTVWHLSVLSSLYLTLGI